MTEHAEIKEDRKRSRKLYMPRNDNRLNQTSKCLLMSWRANCDVQILVYCTTVIQRTQTLPKSQELQIMLLLTHVRETVA